MKIAVIGAGGIGGYLGGRLSQIGNDVTLVARGRHLDAIMQNGLRIESPFGNAHLTSIEATESIPDIGPVDIILATVKLPDLEDVARQFSSMITDTTRIITLQNGVAAKPIIAQFTDEHRIAQGVIYLAAHIKEPGTIMTPGGKHQMLVDGLNGDATMSAFFDEIDRAKAIDVTRLQDVEKVIWSKFTAQSSIAAITSLTRLPLGGVFASEEAKILLAQLIDEAIAVATAKGIALDPDHRETVFRLYGAQPGAQSSSLLVDIEAGKPTELKWLSGHIHDMGKQLGVPTPSHSVVWHALAAVKDGPATIRN